MVVLNYHHKYTFTDDTDILRVPSHPPYMHGPGPSSKRQSNRVNEGAKGTAPPRPSSTHGAGVVSCSFLVLPWVFFGAGTIARLVFRVYARLIEIQRAGPAKWNEAMLAKDRQGLIGVDR